MKTVKQLRRLSRGSDYATPIGKSMVKIAPKTTLVTSVVSAVGFLANAPILENKMAAALIPAILGVGLYAGGWAVQFIPSLLRKMKSRSVQANEGNLLENYLKQQSQDILADIAEKVFKYESLIRYTDAQIAEQKEYIAEQKAQIRTELAGWPKERLGFLGLLDEEQNVLPSEIDNMITWMCYHKPITDEIEKTDEGFVISAMWALLHNMPQAVEESQIGFNLSSLEDMQDGALLDASGNKLEQQYIAKRIIRDIKKECGFNVFDTIKELPDKLNSSFWEFLVLRGVDGAVSSAMNDFNKEYATDIFNAEYFMFPGTEDTEILNAFDGARQAVINRRRNDFQKLFGDEPDEALELLDKRFGAILKSSIKLRSRYDHSYGTNIISADNPLHQRWMLDYNVIDDINELGLSSSLLQKYQAQLNDDSIPQGKFLQYLTDKKPAMFKPKNAQLLRTVLTAFHLNKADYKTEFSKAIQNGTEPDISKLETLLNFSNEYKTTCNRRLFAIRLFQRLTIIYRNESITLINKLALYDPALWAVTVE